ncbi:hypothetical protein YC68_24170 [Vibrio parahaemolyticus]|nr:hypothetical protein YC68_24170 [Vibrio parahaemolyticus]
MTEQKKMSFRCPVKNTFGQGLFGLQTDVLKMSCRGYFRTRACQTKKRCLLDVLSGILWDRDLPDKIKMDIWRKQLRTI